MTVTRENGAEPLGFKPALLRGRLSFELTDAHLVCIDSDGEQKWRVAWREITGAAYVEHTIRGTKIARLDLLTGNRPARRSLQCNCPSADAASDPEYARFRRTVSAITERLAEVTPDLPVTLGEYGRARLAIFLIGAVSALAAIVIAVLATAGGRGDALLGEALLPVTLMLLFGLALTWGSAPWRRPPQVPAKAFAIAFPLTAQRDAE